LDAEKFAGVRGNGAIEYIVAGSGLKHVAMVKEH
jgi:hypothetical protein